MQRNSRNCWKIWDCIKRDGPAIRKTGSSAFFSGRSARDLRIDPMATTPHALRRVMGAATQEGGWAVSQPPRPPDGRTKDPRTQDLRPADRVQKGLAPGASPFFFGWRRFEDCAGAAYGAKTEAMLMQLCKVQLRNGEIRVGVVADGSARFL